MTKALFKVPRIYLELDICRRLFESFRSQIDFDEPIPDFDTRFDDRLESVLGSIKQSFENQLLYPTVLSCAAGYLVLLNRSHPFKNGNKRLSVLYTHIFLLYNGVALTVPEREMFELAIAIARAGESGMENDKLKRFVEEYITKNSKAFQA